MTLCSPGPQIWIPEQGTSGVLPQRVPRPLRGEDQALFLDPRAWRIHLPFPRLGDNGGSTRGGRGVLTQGRDPRHLSPSLPKPCPAQIHRPSPPSLWSPSIWPNALPTLQAPTSAAQTRQQPCCLLSPPCRLSEVKQSRKRVEGKAQVLMMRAE